MNANLVTFSSCADAVRGMCEKHSKMYIAYIARVSEQITKYGTASFSDAGGFAGRHSEATRRKR